MMELKLISDENSLIRYTLIRRFLEKIVDALYVEKIVNTLCVMRLYVKTVDALCVDTSRVDTQIPSFTYQRIISQRVNGL